VGWFVHFPRGGLNRNGSVNDNIYYFFIMMRRLWPLGLVALLSTTPDCAIAKKAVNVALQASFRSPPYLLELLLVTTNLPYRKGKS
jgi:hypothetical protein